MSQIFQLILRVLTFWLIINIIHICLTKLFGEKYNFYLSRNGIFVKFAQLQWHTDRFNPYLDHGFVRRNSSKIAIWFTCGAYFGIIAMFASILILLYTFLISFSEGAEESKVLTPVVPGVNLPNSQIIPYLLTLLISGIFHEYGHALAAAREGVSMYGSGLFLFLIYPAAFVDLNTEALKRCDAFQRLRILCAGVWHNCIMMVGAYIIWNALPFLLMFVGYTKEHAVVVTSVQAGSALDNQLFPGTKLYSVNGCPVADKVSWGQCLWEMYDGKNPGNCVSDDILSGLKSNEDCCQEGVISERCICFSAILGEEACLPARELLFHQQCDTDTQCQKGRCYRPHEREGFLLQILHSSSGTKALFIGDPSHIYYSVHVSDYSSSCFWSGIPGWVELFMIYIVSLSGALAIFNAVPAFFLDGQHMMEAFLELVLGAGDGKARLKERVSFAVLVFSTLLIGVNVINAFVTVCAQYH